MPARYAILGLLLREPMHGYEIDGKFEKGLRNICHVNTSQIYAYLKSMEERGWIQSEHVDQQNSPPKKVFHVTEEGRAEMARWLSEPVMEERQIRDPLYVKLYFSLLLDRAQLPTLLDKQIAIHSQRLDLYHQALRQVSDPRQQIFLDAGRRHACADHEWLCELRARLARGELDTV